MAGEAASEGGGEKAPDLSSFEQRFGNLETELKSTREEAKKSEDSLRRIREVFAPEKEQTPQDRLKSYMDQVLDAHYAAEKAGGGIPLTAQGAIELVALAKEAGKSAEEIKALKTQIEQLTNPDIASDRRTFENLDAGLINELNDMYGKENFSPERFQAVAGEITKEINRLKKEAPDQWQQVKLSPRYQQAMVKHFCQKAIPARARELMEEKALHEYEMTESELDQAFEEAKAIKDEKQRTKIMKSIREEIWERKFYGQKRRNRRA